MTVLTAMQDTCAVIGLELPTAVFGSSEREHVELAALVNEMAERIAKEHDWSKLRLIQTITGNGLTESFTLPADYARMLKEGELWSSLQKDAPLTHISEPDTWLSDIVSGHIAENPQWTIYGDALRLNPVLPDGEMVSYWYIKALPRIVSNDYVFVLGERLLTLAMIWQWKAHKGLPYAEDMKTYEIELKQAIDEDMNASPFATGQQRYRKNDPFITLKELTP